MTEFEELKVAAEQHWQITIFGRTNIRGTLKEFDRHFMKLLVVTNIGEHVWISLSRIGTYSLLQPGDGKNE